MNQKIEIKKWLAKYKVGNDNYMSGARRDNLLDEAYRILSQMEVKTTKNKCQYHYPNCQKIATYQHILKLGAVKIDKGWICGNCKQHIEKTTC